MNNRIVIVLGLSLSLGLTGCFNTPTEDIYNTEDTTVAETNENTTEETNVEGATEGTEVLEGTETTGTEDETVTSDVYESETQLELVTVGELSVDEVSETSIDDPELKEKMSKFLDPFYFSLYFGNKDYTETGITEVDMVLFSLSYCYLHENQAYRFDTTDFKLYVPEERVVELVEKYFGAMLSGHHSIESEDDNISIEYNGGYYLVPTSDVGWNDAMRIDSIKKAGDFAYEVIFTIIDIEGKPYESKQVLLESRGDRFILTFYGDAELVEDAVETADEATEDAEETTE